MKRIVLIFCTLILQNIHTDRKFVISCRNYFLSTYVKGKLQPWTTAFVPVCDVSTPGSDVITLSEAFERNIGQGVGGTSWFRFALDASAQIRLLWATVDSIVEVIYSCMHFLRNLKQDEYSQVIKLQ
jgi:hypothetical protein